MDVSPVLQCTHRLRRELFSLAETLGSWVRILLKAWISVCVFSVFVPSCVQVAAYRLRKMIMKLKKAARAR
jgi:hypothetical protein